MGGCGFAPDISTQHGKHSLPCPTFITSQKWPHELYGLYRISKWTQENIRTRVFIIMLYVLCIMLIRKFFCLICKKLWVINISLKHIPDIKILVLYVIIFILCYLIQLLYTICIFTEVNSFLHVWLLLKKQL